MENQTQLPVNQSVSETVIQTEQLPKKSNFLIILLSSLLIISLMIAGFFAFQTQRLVKELRVMSDESKQKTVATPEPTSDPTADWKTYTNDKYKFSLKYPSEIKNHKVSINVMKITGFGYCYLYNDEKTIVVDGINAKTADGVGTGDTEICDQSRDIMSKKGNTFVLIPLGVNNGDLPEDQIFINYDYPLSDLNVAKNNFDQILSTFKFTN